MTELVVLIQYVLQQRAEPPIGFRIWSDGRAQHCANTSLLDISERLDIDRELIWRDDPQLDAAHLQTIRDAIRSSGIFDLEPRLLINYCKDDPGAAIWSVKLNGRTAHIVVYDPKPRRSAELDSLLNAINAALLA